MNHQQEKPYQEDDTMKARYQRAQTLIQGFATQNLVQNDTIFPTWVDGADCFWYERAYKAGDRPSGPVCKEYRLVDAKAKTNEIAFNHRALADALAKTSGQSINKENLPISHITIALSPLTIGFNAFDKRWQFEDEKNVCKQIKDLVKDGEVLSPNGKFIVFAHDHNLWVTDLTSGEERALTNDGEEDYAYGVRSSAWGMRYFSEVPAIWSPDSTRVLTVQRDRRQVKSLPMVNHVPGDGSIRPTLERVKVAYPGDKHVETYQVLTLDVASGTACKAKYHPMPACINDYFSFFNNKLVWWANDSRYAYFIDQERGDQVVRLVEFDTDNGNTRVLFDEISDTHINITTDVVGFPLYRFLPSSNELVWWSERNDWGHLYLYDLSTGDLKHAITSGNWRVRDILHVDEIRRELFIQTSARISGQDPDDRDMCRVQIDTGEITTILSGNEELVVHYQNSCPVYSAKMIGRASESTTGVAPSGNYIVTTRSRADQVPVTQLINRRGKLVLELEITNISMLPEGWQWPEPVTMLSADGKTDIYGLLFRPSKFSPAKLYPVINYIVSAPWLSVVPKGSFHNSRGYSDRHYFYGAALAELGFIVVLIDSRGTPLRNKAFQDESYGWIPSSANKADHISGLKQLSKRYPFMDMDRIGVFSNGYRSGLQNFLECQEHYKVCVVMGLLDSRLIGSAIEGDKWEGVDGPTEDRCYPEQLVDNLQGKLLLMHAVTSTLSASYPPAATFRVIDALQKANKDFDMLIVSDGGFMCTSYMFRRAWDYLVQHLLNRDPPKNFKLEEVHMST